jgi:cell division protein FtsW (lipid II flippase)
VALAGVFAFGAVVIMLGVHDNSPVVILLALALPFLWILAPSPLIPHPAATWLRRSLLVGMPLALVVAAAAWLWQHPPDLLSDLPQADRFRVWSDPWGNRHSGDQLIQALLRVREGGWSGVSAWLGANREVMGLPAVQDDFIAAFLLNRFGGLVGLVLVAVQVLWLGVLLTLAGRLMRGAPDAMEARGLFWVGGLLFGLAWMQLAHWGISWGNVLGLLPVMGQPMTWLSSGNSHMLALALPALVFGMVGGWLARDLGASPRDQSTDRSTRSIAQRRST